MIYEFALIGRSEEAINIHVDTMSIHCQLFLYTCRSRKRSFCMRKYCSFQVVFWVIWFSCLCLFPFSGVCLYSQRSEDRYGDDIPKWRSPLGSPERVERTAAKREALSLGRKGKERKECLQNTSWRAYVHNVLKTATARAVMTMVETTQGEIRERGLLSLLGFFYSSSRIKGISIKTCKSWYLCPILRFDRSKRRYGHKYQPSPRARDLPRKWQLFCSGGWVFE